MKRFDYDGDKIQQGVHTPLFFLSAALLYSLFGVYYWLVVFDWYMAQIWKCARLFLPSSEVEIVRLKTPLVFGFREVVSRVSTWEAAGPPLQRDLIWFYLIKGLYLSLSLFFDPVISEIILNIDSFYLFHVFHGFQIGVATSKRDLRYWKLILGIFSWNDRFCST